MYSIFFKNVSHVYFVFVVQMLNCLPRVHSGNPYASWFHLPTAVMNIMCRYMYYKYTIQKICTDYLAEKIKKEKSNLLKR